MASKSSPTPFALRQQMLDECVAMARYALASGMPVTPSMAESIDSAAANLNEPSTLAQLVKAHGQLSRLVAPATPRALLAMGAEHGGNRMAWLGAVGLVQRLMFAAVTSVLIFFTLSATRWTSGHVRISFENSSGWVMLANQLFWMSAAGIGASFAMLMQVNGYIVRRTYDPKYEPTYWIKFILGVMAGYILVALIPISASESSAGGAASLTLPTLAMLGGFSASAVYRILAKLVESLEAVFRSSPAEEMAARERAAQSRATEEVSQARLKIAGQIVALQQQLTSGKDPAEVAEALRTMFTTLIPATAAPQDAATAPSGSIALPNVPIVSDAGVVQPPVTPALVADASDPDGEIEPAASESSIAEYDGFAEAETRPVARG